MDQLPVLHADVHTEHSRSHLQRIFTLLTGLKGKTSPAAHIEEEAFRIREGFQNFKLEAVEKQAPEIDFRRTGQQPGQHLVHFARVLQRTQLIGHFYNKGVEVPIHYSITGAVLLERRGRKFKVWGEPELRNTVLLPFGFVPDPKLLEAFQGDSDLRLVDSGGDRPEYTQLRISAVKKAQEMAMELRARIYLRWLKAEGSNVNDVLTAHGSVVDVPNKYLSQNFIALDQRVYLPWQNSELLEAQLQVPAYGRGQLLRVSNTVGDDPMTKYMWFVRLRNSSKADPEFGLLSCLILAENDQQAIERANQFSQRVIEERLPVTFPEDNWDKLIFPLKLCRDYLDSLVPTRETVRSYFGRE